jgi:hypothetical protein
MASATIIAMNSRGGGKRSYHRGEGEASFEDKVFPGQKYGSGSNKSLSQVSMKAACPLCLDGRLRLCGACLARR